MRYISLKSSAWRHRTMTFEPIFGRFNLFDMSIFGIQTPIAPNVHSKMNTGKECSSAECARLRSRLHCVTTRRVASTRQGVRRAPPFDFRHRPASCVCPAPRFPCGIRMAIVPFQSARGLAHSKTLRVRRAAPHFRQVLDCGGPPPLFPRSSIPK